MAKKIELLHTTYDESGNVESQEVVHPLTSPDCIIMENGKTLDEVMGDGIATPTLTHEGTSFKVGVGDSNIEVVDGDVAGMTLKGQSYQNILPKPTTLIMETDEQEFKINDKIDSNIIIDDNIAEIATVKGKTIVNTVQEESASEYTVLGEDLSGQSIVHIPDFINVVDYTDIAMLQTTEEIIGGKHYYTIKEGTDVNSSYVTPQINNQFLYKPDTDYTIIVDIVENTTGKRLGISNYRTPIDYTNNTNSGRNFANLTGISKLVIHTKSDLTQPGQGSEVAQLVYFGIWAASGDFSKHIKFNFMIIEGNHLNTDIPYFEPNGNIKGVTLQGQTLVNAIQEPCEDDYVVLGSEDGIEISAETGGHGTIEDTVQGGLNGAVLEGMTLVNIHPSNLYHLSTSCPNGTFTNVVSTTRELSFTVSLNPSTGWYYMGGGLLNLTFIKPSTKYIIMFDKCDGVLSVAFANANSLNTIAHNTPIQINKHGIPYSIVTTLDEYVEDTQILYLVPKNVVGTKVHVTNARIFEYQNGLENLDIPYFEGMKSVQMPVVKTTGKNLFDGKLEKGLINDNTGKPMNNEAYVRSVNFIKVQPNKTYVIHEKDDSTNFKVYEYDENFNYIDSSNKKTFITDSNTYYIKFRTFPKNSGDDVSRLDFKVMLETGDTATPYEPYQSSTVTTGKNLFDGILTPDYLTDSTGQPSGLNGSLAHSCYAPSFIPIQANEKFRLRATSDGSTTVGDGRVYFYDKDYNYLNVYVTSLEVYTSTYSMDAINTVPNNSNIAYMRVRFYNGIGVQADSVQINKVYELRAIGDIKDELDLQTGKLTQRIEEYTELSNSQCAITNLYQLDGHTTFSFGDWTHKLKNAGSIFSNKLPYPLQGEGVYFDGWGLYLRIKNDKLTTLDSNGLKEWLIKEDFIIVFPMKTETIKTIDLQVTDQDGNTIPHIQTQPTVTHITASSNHLIPTVTIDNNLTYDTIIKPSRLYTVRFKHDTVNADNPLTVDLGGTTQTVTSTEFTITTPNELTHNQLVFSGKNNVVSEVQVIEGDVVGTQYPFFEGMSDVKFSDSQFVGRGRNLVRHLSASSYYGFTIQEAQGSSTIINGTLTTDYRDYYIVGTNANTHLIDYFNKMKVGETIHFSSNITGFAHHIAIGKPQQSNTYYCVDKYTKQSQDDVLLSMFIRFTKDCSFNNNELQIQIEEGSTATSYESYKCAEVQQDVDSIPLTSDMFEQGKRERGLGMSFQQCPLTSNSARISSKTLIPVKPNSKYVVQGITSANHVWGDMYDKDGLLCYDNVYGLVNTVIPHDVHYLLVQVKNADESAISPSILDSMNLILQEVPQEIVLRGIGDVKDELDLTRGEYIQRVQQVVLDGSDDEAWAQTYGNSNPIMTIWLDIPNKTGGVSGRMVCDKLSTGKEIYSGDTNLGICFVKDTNELYKNIRIRTQQILNGQTVDSFKSWLQQNPITVQYVLETPIIHKVNLTNTKVIPSYATETHYETITPSDSLIPNITIPSTLNYDVAIKPSTQYTIRANTSDNLTVDLGGTTGTLSNGKVTLTTPATLTHNEVKFSGTGKVKELMVVEGNEIKDNVPFFNGMKDVQMGGIKLVNIARGATCSALVTANTNKTQFTYTGNGSGWGYIWFDTSLLKPNTKYTLYVEVIKDNGTDASGSIKWEIGHNGGQYAHNIVNYIGIYKKAIISIDEDVMRKDHLILAFRPTASGNQVVIQNPMIIEGDWTYLDEIPYIESEMIIDQPIIRSQGKNLLDLESKPFTVASAGTTFTKSGNTYTVTTTLANSTPYDYIRRVWTVNNDKWLRDVAGKKLTLSVSSISCTNSNSMACIQLRIECMDGTKYYPGIHNGGKTVTFNMPINVKDLQMQVMTNNTGAALTEDAVLTISNIQLELGDGATSYEPYKHQTLYSNRVIGYEENCYYGGSDGKKYAHAYVNTVIADVEGLSIAYITNVSTNITFWDKDDVYILGKSHIDTALSNPDINGFVIVPSNAKYVKFASGNVSEEYATYYTKATVTGELPLRSLPSGVCDTLNLVTGEYVQRVGEVVFDGSENWSRTATAQSDKYRVYIRLNDIKNVTGNNIKNILMCDKYTNITADNTYNLWKGISLEKDYGGGSALVIYDEQFSTITNNIEFQKYLSQNPITVQYELATPIVRKLGFTTKGNYKEITLNGSENWDNYNRATGLINTVGYLTSISDSLNLGETEIYSVFAEEPFSNIASLYRTDAEGCNFKLGSLRVSVKKSRLDEVSSTGFKRYVSLNPFKIGYISTVQSATTYSNIHKPIFFNNVNVQYLPNNVDIQPQLTLQARTRNSYVMDMMKANTKYSIKLLDSSGNMTIDGTSYTLANNRTFVSPSTLTNKELIVGQWYEPMIIEGDITGKNLPYFKGILSSYHDVDEIEVYSVNKNVFDGELEMGSLNNDTGDIYDVTENCIRSKNFIKVHPNTPYYINCSNSEYLFATYHYDENYKYIRVSATTSSGQSVVAQGSYIKIRTSVGLTQNDLSIKIWITEAQATSYTPHAHNTTLIEMPTRLETVKVVRPELTEGALEITNGAECASTTEWRSNFIPVQPSEFIKVRNGSEERLAHIDFYDINKNFISYSGVVNATYVPDNCYFIRFFMTKSNCSDLTITRQAWKPIQLNSLPNGVYDEIIMKPNSNKAQLVQRVGKVVLDGSEDISTDSAVMTSDYTLNGISTYFRVNPTSFTLQKSPSSYNGQPNMLCDSLVATSRQESQQTISNSICIYNDGFGMRPKNDVNNALSLQAHLQQNPITVYYELATPIIHEIQLKGYPHVYENGTVTLNTDTPHQTLVSYNVNQEQLINTQNETIIRHDQQIDDLYYYIEMYLEEIYQMELFRMKLELSL